MVRCSASWRVLACSVSVGCTPDTEVIGTLDASSSSSAGAATTTGTAQDETSNASADHDADETASAADASSSESGSMPADPCFGAAADACPEGCSVVQGWLLTDDGCSEQSVDVCVGLGEEPMDTPTTFWVEGPDAAVFVEAGSCGVDARPSGNWTECGDDADPIGCSCFCSGGLCPGDADRLALEACGLAEPCPVVWIEGLSGTVDVRAEACVLEALIDHAPGLYTIGASFGFSGGFRRFHVDDTGVQIISHSEGDVQECPETSGWGEVSRCELAPSEYFTACLDQLGTEQDCALTFDAWTTDCVVQPPTCPG